LFLKNLEILINRRWLIVNTFLAFVIPVLIKLLFFSTPYYEASASILPSIGSKNSRTMGLAATTALKLITGGGSSFGASETALYEDILKSRHLVYKVLKRKYIPSIRRVIEPASMPNN